MDHNFKFTDQQTHDDQNASASARPKVPEKPKSLTYRQESTTKTPKDVTAAYGSNGPSLVKVFDTAASDELYDDINDEFGFFPKESSDTVTVTIKFSSADKAIVAETQKGESSAARPKEIRQRKKSPDSALVVRDAEKKTNNVLAVKSKHENTFGNSELVESSHNKHNDDAAADNLSFDINDYSVPSPIPPPRSKKNNRAQTLAAEDLLGVEPQHVTIIQNNSHASNGIVTETQKGESSAARPKEIRQRKKSTDSELVVLPIASAQPISRNTGSQYHTPEHQYTQKEKEHARNTISKKLKEVVSPKTSTKIVYDRSPISPVTSTPIELDRSGPADQDEGEDFMEYLKGLKADFSSSSSESEDNEHVLYARRQGDIGGSGENGFHLDDLQALLDDDDTIEAGEIQLPYTDETVDKEEYDTEPKIDQLEDTSKDIVNSDTDKHGSESENSDNDTEDDKSDDDDDDNGEDEDDEKEEDKEDDDDKDENTGDETSNDDDQYFDGQEDDGSDREGSFYDSSSESSDESNGDERFFGFTPGLRSRCNILARNMDETEDVQIPTEMKVINEFSSLLVEKILGNVISILSVTLSARSRNVAVDKQTYEIEPETNKFINAESNIMNIQQVSCESGRLITNAMGKANKSLNNQIDLKIANVKEMRNESIQTSQLSDSDNSMTSSKCYLVENIENFAYEHSKDSTGSFPKSCMSLSSDDNDLNCTVSALNQNEENPVNKIESGDNIDVFPDIDESTETEFESANDDESDDYWSVTLEHTLDSENNIENTDSNEFESSSEHECGSSDTCSSDCFTGENNQLPAVTIMPGISNDVSDTCPDKDVNGTETIKTSVTGFKCTPNIMKMTERVQRDNDTKIINEENIKLPLGASTIPAKEIDVDNAENSQTNPVDNGNCNKESTTSNESQADRNKTPFSDVSATEENSSCGDNSKGETRNMLNIRNYQIDLREDAIKDELQNISVSDQLFDEDLSTVFKEVNELIENMGHDSQSNNIKTQSKTQEMTDESNPKGKLQPIEKDDAVSSEKKKARAKRKDLHTITERDLPKIRTITYNVPYIIHETKTSLTPEERRQHMMLCQKKLSLLNGRKRNENAQRNKINRRRILKKGDFNGFDTDNEAKKNIPVSNLKTFKVGTGYIILEAGEVLNIPNGQNVNVARNGPDGCQGRPCKYFRGLPGVINNAYKMSNIFPKARPATTASPNHILHACNRLATPVIPTSTPSPSKERYGIMLEACTSQEDADDETDLKEILNKARDHLNSSKFDDAEAAFLKLYQQIQEKPEDNGKLLVETLMGLADICIRRSRMCRSNPLEWQWLCMHAIALLQYTVEFCDSELEDEQDNQLSEWLQEQKHASELKCRPLEDAFVRALYNSLKHNANFFDPFQSFSLPNTPINSSRKTNLFPLSTNMPQYLVIPGMRYRVTDQGLQKQSADDSNMAVDWLAKFQHYCKDRLQTKDSMECTEKILKSNASKADDDDDTESVISQGSQGSLDWDNGDLQGIDEPSEEVVDEESPVKDFSLAFELASIDSGNESWEFFLDKRQNCDFQTIVQVSDETTDGQGEKEDEQAETTSKETEDARQQEKHTKIVLRDMISPLHEHSISLTLSRSFCRLADKLVQEEEYRKAEAVYDKILDIIDTIQDGTAGMLKFSARIMKNLGTVKSKLGKSSSGLALLNKALQTYRDLQDEEANFEIAIALIELGNGYIVGKNHEDSVFEDVIIAICDFFEKDSGDPQSTSTSSCGSTSVMTSSLRSNDEERNVEEAVMCYSEAITLLDTYAADERQNEMFAKAIMRLGDCFFMQNDYDRALDCYERALGMFRACNIFGKDSLMENAHVLCMLGVSSFMLHVYPRAASVFETALHMVKCAYGFRRTFLNGMLQSLCGITYYKMKNYHKCVSMCYQSFETYCDIYGEELTRLNKQKFWLVCQTLYVMGNSYNILSLYQKSIKYLTTARSLMKSSKSRERRQFMRVLQILGDSYFAQYDYKTALTFYNEALEYGECESTISFDEVFDPNLATDEMAIHNRLVSKSAEAHLSMQQYQNAVHYLEQAHDIQEVLGEDIKEDLINTLNQLGEMHSMAGDVDKAIESYKECLEVFREIHQGELGPDMCPTLGNLAAICYVKACLSDEIEQELHMIQMADQYFKEALKLDTDDSVCVKYANFLYSQGHYEEAINDLNDALQFEDHMQMCDIVYTGLEKITLPDLLQDEVDTQEEICLPSACLARYLLILCHKAIGQNFEAETNLIGLMDDVTDYDIPLLHSLLGYAMMELSLFEEAAFSFFKAFETEEDYILASENFCICAIIILMKTFENAVLNIWEYYRPGQKRCLK